MIGRDPGVLMSGAAGYVSLDEDAACQMSSVTAIVSKFFTG